MSRDRTDRHRLLLASILGSALLWLGCGRERTSARHAEPRPGAITAREQIHLDLLELQSSGQLGELTTLSVDDPVYEKRVTYEGYRLRDLLRRFTAPGSSGSVPDMSVIFRCRDGYSPAMPLAKALSADGMIAVRDVSAGHGHAWVPFEQRGVLVDPSPFYLVWDGLLPSMGYPWPYQVVRIDILPDASAYGDAFPGGGAVEARGFRVFRDNCLKCHSVNLVGGSVGIEMNVPVNITEYWDEFFIRQYIRTPSSVRARARMPAFPELPDKDLAAILRYLQWMSRRKVCDDAGSCEQLSPGGE